MQLLGDLGVWTRNGATEDVEDLARERNLIAYQDDVAGSTLSHLDSVVNRKGWHHPVAVSFLMTPEWDPPQPTRALLEDVPRVTCTMGSLNL